MRMNGSMREEGGEQEGKSGAMMKWAGSESPAAIEGERLWRSISSPLPSACVTF